MTCQGQTAKNLKICFSYALTGTQIKIILVFNKFFFGNKNLLGQQKVLDPQNLLRQTSIEKNESLKYFTVVVITKRKRAVF